MPLQWQSLEEGAGKRFSECVLGAEISETLAMALARGVHEAIRSCVKLRHKTAGDRLLG